MTVIFLDNKKKRREERMATLLGKGGYGSVYSSNKDPTKVIKIYHKRARESASDLEKKQEYLNRRNPKRNIFSAMIQKLQRRQNDRDVIYSVTMKNQGIPVDTINFTDRLYMATLFLNLLRGLVIFMDDNYVHGDVKLNNIMYDESKHELKYIDYDFMSLDPHDISSILSVGTYYFVWPPEIFLSAEKKLDLYSDIDDDTNMSNFKTLGGILKFNPFVLKRILSGFISSSPSKITHPWLRKLYIYMRNKDISYLRIGRQYHANRPWIREISKIDIFSLGLVAFELFYTHIPELRDLIERMIEPDPALRVDPLTAFREWKRVIDSLHAAAHKKKKTALQSRTVGSK